jgi:hypothetical protein
MARSSARWASRVRKASNARSRPSIRCSRGKRPLPRDDTEFENFRNWTNPAPQIRNPSYQIGQHERRDCRGSNERLGRPTKVRPAVRRTLAILLSMLEAGPGHVVNGLSTTRREVVWKCPVVIWRIRGLNRWRRGVFHVAVFRATRVPSCRAILNTTRSTFRLSPRVTRASL